MKNRISSPGMANASERPKPKFDQNHASTASAMAMFELPPPLEQLAEDAADAISLGVELQPPLRPLGSPRFTGPFPAQAYWFIPAPRPNGSADIHRPPAGT